MSTVHKALPLLDIFSPETPEIGLPEISDSGNLDRATARRYVLALVTAEETQLWATLSKQVSDQLESIISGY